MSAPIKISIIGTKGYPYVYGGFETLIKELVERLVNKNVEITVYCHKTLFKDRPRFYNNVRLVYIPAIELKSFTQLTHSLLSTIHACFRKNDILFYVNAANGPLGLLTRLFGIKTVINVDGVEWLRPKWKGIGAKYFYFAAKQSARNFDVVITDAFEMQKIYKSLFNISTKMIAYGSDPVISQPKSLLGKWSLSGHDYYLVVGRLIADNNIDLLIKGFLAANSSKKLVIVGDDVFNKGYSKMIKQLGNHPNIIFTGYVKETSLLSALYQHCFVYLHGHEFGGTNPTLIKAMAEGTCILALNTRFSREVLQDGNKGILFKKHLDDLSRQMIDLENTEHTKQDKVIEYREKSKTGITQIYQWEYIADQYYQIFLSLTDEGDIQ